MDCREVFAFTAGDFFVWHHKLVALVGKIRTWTTRTFHVRCLGSQHYQWRQHLWPALLTKCHPSKAKPATTWKVVRAVWRRNPPKRKAGSIDPWQSGGPYHRQNTREACFEDPDVQKTHQHSLPRCKRQCQQTGALSCSADMADCVSICVWCAAVIYTSGCRFRWRSNAARLRRRRSCRSGYSWCRFIFDLDRILSFAFLFPWAFSHCTNNPAHNAPAKRLHIFPYRFSFPWLLFRCVWHFVLFLCLLKSFLSFSSPFPFPFLSPAFPISMASGLLLRAVLPSRKARRCWYPHSLRLEIAARTCSDDISVAACMTAW